MTTIMTGINKSSATTMSTLSKNSASMSGGTKNLSLARLLTQAGDFLTTQAGDYLTTVGRSTFEALAKN